MKKILLFAAALMLTAGANAQLIEDVDMNQVANKAPVVNDETLPSPYYNIPMGTYFSGFAKGAYRLNNPMLHVPPFVDMTFVNGSSDFTSFQWSYVNPEGEYNFLNPLLTSTDESITVNYQYLEPTTIEAPQITATNEFADSTTSFATNTPSYMRVGGPSGFGSTAQTYYGWTNVSPRAGNMSYSTNYFGTNVEASGTQWDSRLGVTGAVVRGFGELYFKPLAPYALTGVATHIRSLASDYAKPGAIKMTIYKVETDDAGNLTEVVEEVASQTLQPADMVEAGGSSNPLTRYYLAFNDLVDAKTGETVEGYTIDYPILVTFVLADEEDGASQFSPLYTGVTPNMTSHAYVVVDAVKDGAFETGLMGQVKINWTSGARTRGWAVSIMGAFEYLRGEETEMQAAPEGESKTFALQASQPAYDITGDLAWTVTLTDGTENRAEPDWVHVGLADYNETVEGESVYQHLTYVAVTADANDTGEARECDVKLAFLGAEYTIHVMQESVTTGVEQINVAEDDTHAPTYNMMGQRVAPNAKGLLIRGGKKVLVK